MLQECFKNGSASKTFPLRSGKHKYKHLTLNQLCTLYAIQNPIVKYNRDAKVSEADICIFLFVTQSEDFDIMKLSSVAFDAVAWFEKTGIDINEASEAISKLISLAFQPLDFFPQTSEKLAGDNNVRFDSDWCASMISTVHQMTGFLPDQILSMPVASCAWYFLQYAKQQGQKGIERKSDAQIIAELDFRINALIAERLCEKRIITKEEIPYVEQLLRSPSKREKNFKLLEPHGDFAAYFRKLNKGKKKS